ncbi:MAG: hypothetical protein JW778_02600 [Candidatus Altiarchaeota archaeon]|nr:hypothetical protein [Candidatus Altiarchaeota archaeon]
MQKTKQSNTKACLMLFLFSSIIINGGGVDSIPTTTSSSTTTSTSPTTTSSSTTFFPTSSSTTFFPTSSSTTFFPTSSTIIATTQVERRSDGGSSCCDKVGVLNVAKPKPTCFDGIKNCHDGSCEMGIDCGGPCRQCMATTSEMRATSTTKALLTTTTGASTTSTTLAPDLRPSYPVQSTTSKEKPGVVGDLVEKTGNIGVILFVILLLILLLITLITHHSKKKEDFEAERKYGGTIDSILEERGLLRTS